jgi:hypothetical protein
METEEGMKDSKTEGDLVYYCSLWGWKGKRAWIGDRVLGAESNL